MRVKMIKVINGRRYNTKTATVIASNEFWGDSTHERGGTNRHLPGSVEAYYQEVGLADCVLYKTRNGNFFEVLSTFLEDARKYYHPRIHYTLEPLTLAQARVRYQELRKKEVPFEEAFPADSGGGLTTTPRGEVLTSPLYFVG